MLIKLTESNMDDAPDGQYIDTIKKSINKIVDAQSVITSATGQQQNALFDVMTVDVQMPDCFIKPTMGSFWSPTNVFLRKHNDGLVELNFATNGGFVTQVMTLPTGYTPANDMNFIWWDAFALIAELGTISASTGIVDLGSHAGTSSNVKGTVCFTAADQTPIVPSCFPLFVKCKLTSINGLWAVAVADQGSAASAAQKVNGFCYTVDYTGLPNGQIKINNIPGLPFNRKSTVTLLAIKTA